ncbi:MAG: hypothetical protein WDM91_15520 [Rhizomicrobium sp.]
MSITYTIRYRRPEAPWSVVVMVVPNGADMALAQVQRLRALGYAVFDVTPALPDPAHDGLAARVPDAA